jgi:RES domain
MAGLRPTKAFARIYPQRYPEPLGFGKTRSRFSDPRHRSEDRRFGVLYLGSTLKGCFIETILRDRRNGVVGDYPIEEAELIERRYAEIVVTSSLDLVELRGDARIRIGIPSDVAGWTRQPLARAWSVAFYEHPTAPDGIIYSSRLNDDTNLAVYDRAIGKLCADRIFRLIEAPGFAGVLDAFKVALV